ncbi:methionine aminopeptidase 1D, mitochondrial [Drosophila ficusphila]|uniref:methionine aminopeptidase 1D, mitochondrial n=1 Tax=Drosophila ficusphila TaxID=30025 RepID=UPI0007E69341|nr:methionine aminopeptidase 1D, mitochondrial [Drosophila ficusphila]
MTRLIFLNRILMQNAPARSFFQFGKAKGDTGKYEQIISTGLVSPERSVPDDIKKPKYYFENLPPGNTLGSPEIKTPDQIEAMRKSGKLAAQILRECGKLATVGTTTDEIDAFAHEKIIEAKAYPSPLRYAGFPKSICTSINNIACHGIPDDRQLANGDIINIDVTVFLNGYHGDCSETFQVGDVDERGSFLVEATRSCLEQSITLCGPGVEFNEIGKFIENYCDKNGLESIAAFIGHGIGSYFHGPPEIYHYYNEYPGEMQPGMTFTIEPILSLGGSEIAVLEDGWTAISLDGARSAQFEHTILITETGTEILTKDN